MTSMSLRFSLKSGAQMEPHLHHAHAVHMQTVHVRIHMADPQTTFKHVISVQKEVIEALRDRAESCPLGVWWCGWHVPCLPCHDLPSNRVVRDESLVIPKVEVSFYYGESLGGPLPVDE